MNAVSTCYGLGALDQKFTCKAEALQYAIGMSAKYENNETVIQYDKAKELYDFICSNVSLPDIKDSMYSDMLNRLMAYFDRVCENRA